MKKLIVELKEFAMRGNVLDMAVGVIIGGAFGKIVSSLVEDIIMPLLSVIIGTVSFQDLSVTVNSAEIRYGMFLQNVMDFVLIASSIFIVVKAINSFRRKSEAPPEEPPKPSAEEKLLEEIRDILRSK